MKTTEDFLKDKGLDLSSYHIIDTSRSYNAQIPISTWLKEYALKILKEIFENGLGELDENCSKDDLVEQYLEFKKMLE